MSSADGATTRSNTTTAPSGRTTPRSRRGVRRYGYRQQAATLAVNLLEAAAAFDYRLPEVFAGFAREPGCTPVAYPTPSRPQAWAAGAVLLALRTLLGLDVDDGQLTSVGSPSRRSDQPACPAFRSTGGGRQPEHLIPRAGRTERKDQPMTEHPTRLLGGLTPASRRPTPTAARGRQPTAPTHLLVPPQRRGREAGGAEPATRALAVTGAGGRRPARHARPRHGRYWHYRPWGHSR